jgi:hypothetical protein
MRRLLKEGASRKEGRGFSSSPLKKGDFVLSSGGHDLCATPNENARYSTVALEYHLSDLR